MPAIVRVESISDIVNEEDGPSYGLDVRFGGKTYKTRTTEDRLVNAIAQGQVSVGDDTAVLLSGTNEFVSNQRRSRNVLRSVQKH